MCAGLVGSALAVRLSEILIERLIHWDVQWEQGGDRHSTSDPSLCWATQRSADYQEVPVLLPA